MNRRAVLIGLLVAIVVGAGGWWIHSNYELVTERVWRGFRGEARRNDLLAAEYFLRRMGVEARSVGDLQSLEELPEGGILLIHTERWGLDDARNEKLLAWAARGGHLILRPQWTYWDEEPRPDPLLASLGVRSGSRNEMPEEEALEETVSQGDPEYRRSECGGSPIYLWLPGEEDPLEIDFLRDQVLERDEPELGREFSDTGEHRMLQYQWEEGLITVLSDTGFLNNNRIAEYDHARLLFSLALQRPGPLWLMYNDELPPLWLWLWRKTPMVIAAAALLFMVWLLRAPCRFGPLLPAPSLRRRRIMEHIEAGGLYLWKKRQTELLLNGPREALLVRIQLRHPDLAGLPPGQLARRLAEISGIGIKQIEQALYGEVSHTREAFTRQVQILENIRKQL